MNHVALIGRLTADPELRYTPNGTAVCTVTIAINRPPNKDGQSEADFIRCVVWGKVQRTWRSIWPRGGSWR